MIVDGETIYGDGVNVAARIEALCEPGGVWLSRSVYNQVKGKLDLAFVPTGLHQVKNISEAVETFRVALDGMVPAAPASAARRPTGNARRLIAARPVRAVFLGGVWHFWPAEPPPAKPSIAVLPFDNLGGDEATGRLADGITEDIITDLARFRDRRRHRPQFDRVYKGKAIDVRQIGRELGVRYVLEGSIQRQADRCGSRLSSSTPARAPTSGRSAGTDRSRTCSRCRARWPTTVASRLGGYGAIAGAAARRRQAQAARRTSPPTTSTCSGSSRSTA